ncbi:glutamate-ammonia-ligase adenylyltransferase [bacterium]|nr:glutamate-ammonia-ligase adenylyltransferase [bacterium]
MFAPAVTTRSTVIKPDLDTLRAALPDVDARLIEQHLALLSDRYFASFDPAAQQEHLAALACLDPANPVELLLRRTADGMIQCTFLAFDYPYAFSLVTGLLSASGFSISSGDVFTYGQVVPPPAKRRGRTRRGTPDAQPDTLGRRRIIDAFYGGIDRDAAFEQWAAQVRAAAREVFLLLEEGAPDAIVRARHFVNERVAQRLGTLRLDSRAVLYPVQLSVDSSGGPHTRLRVVSEDTPAFLYSLSNALSAQGMSIEHVRIRTIRGRIEDDLEIVDAHGRPITDPAVVDQVKFCVLLTKQFTYFLVKAVDPYSALSRFEQMVKDLVRQPGRQHWLEMLSDPHALGDLARLLGASDFLWEDFIRLQYESLAPILEPHVAGRHVSPDTAALPGMLDEALAAAHTYEERCAALNTFKDRQIYLADLDQILLNVDFRKFAARLTALAELVVETAARLVYEHQCARHGVPRTVGGMAARYALFGLGKFGGAALGYASDIELLVVYSDSGRTDGAEPVDNGEFYSRMVTEITRVIQARREGIFHVDVRLRPYGNAGPAACSLESFCQYYGSGGKALSYERLALVRLRAVGGDAALGAQVERLRDEFVYAAKAVDFKELRDLRQKQFQEKTKGGRLNAKFSPGSLVDVEYDVQILQVTYGADNLSLRTPRVHDALAALVRAGVLGEQETRRLTAAYDFLRRLINAMRMLRGSAVDLFLPPPGSDEYMHLARRMGYSSSESLSAAQQLHVDFETHTAVVRAFVERHFGRDSLPGHELGTIADLVLSDAVPERARDKALERAGFALPGRAYVNLRSLAGTGARREQFVALAVLACDMLAHKPDPDMALNNWERFVSCLASPGDHFALLRSQPMRLDILLSIFAGSQFLADTLIANPEFFDWVTTPRNLQRMRDREELDAELRDVNARSATRRDWQNALRRLRRREILRIGTRDMWLNVAVKEITREISLVAEALTQAALARCWREACTRLPAAATLEQHFCIFAFGKLGGGELNYSSDIDLLGMYDDVSLRAAVDAAVFASAPDTYAKLIEGLRADLADHTEEGYAYRVDFRLRPFGSSGELVTSLTELQRYYLHEASLWEVQASLKLRPIAGNVSAGNRFLSLLLPLWTEQRSRNDVGASISSLRDKAMKHYAKAAGAVIDVKTGIGGIRDIEFLAQGLQLVHAHAFPEILSGNTLDALDKLAACELLPHQMAGQLRADYVFLRRIEHYLQILEDRQIHALPKKREELTALARRILGIQATADEFMEEVDACLRRVHDAYLESLSPRNETRGK